MRLLSEFYQVLENVLSITEMPRYTFTIRSSKKCVSGHYQLSQKGYINNPNKIRATMKMVENMIKKCEDFIEEEDMRLDSFALSNHLTYLGRVESRLWEKAEWYSNCRISDYSSQVPEIRRKARELSNRILSIKIKYDCVRWKNWIESMQQKEATSGDGWYYSSNGWFDLIPIGLQQNILD